MRDKKGRFIKGNIPEIPFKKGMIPWNKDRKETRPEVIGKMKESRRKAIFSTESTSIEIKVYTELKRLGFLFEKQRLINDKFVVDAYIPSLNLIIEADGDYWHSLDRVKKKDKAKNAYLKKCGFNLLRIPEHKIKTSEFNLEKLCQNIV